MDMSTKIEISNPMEQNNVLVVQPDLIAGENYVCLNVMLKGEYLPLSSKDLTPYEGDEYFHMNKKQVGDLIKYLKQIHINM